MAKELLQKLKKARIPNTYYALIATAFVLVIGVGYLATIAGQKQLVEEASTPAPEQPVMSQVSQRATDQLYFGMTREETIRLLGIPTWAAVYGDEGPLSPPDESIGLELRWDNPTCRDVLVMFSPPPHRVIGWDTGANYCRTGIVTDRSGFECSNPDRQQYCR